MPGDLCDFYADGAVLGLDGFGATGQGVAADFGAANAQGGGLCEQGVLQAVGMGWLSKDLNENAGPVFQCSNRLGVLRTWVYCTVTSSMPSRLAVCPNGGTSGSGIVPPSRTVCRKSFLAVSGSSCSISWTSFSFASNQLAEPGGDPLASFCQVIF